MRNRGKDETSRLMRRRIQEEEEEIIRVPAFDNSDLIEKFKLTLVGRMFHEDGRRVEALLKHMPKRRIWDVEGRVRGTNLGNNKFQFDFDKEEDLLKVLQHRPCHFNNGAFPWRDGSQLSKKISQTLFLFGLWSRESQATIKRKRLIRVFEKLWGSSRKQMWKEDVCASASMETNL